MTSDLGEESLWLRMSLRMSSQGRDDPSWCNVAWLFSSGTSLNATG